MMSSACLYFLLEHDTAYLSYFQIDGREHSLVQNDLNKWMFA